MIYFFASGSFCSLLGEPFFCWRELFAKVSSNFESLHFVYRLVNEPANPLSTTQRIRKLGYQDFLTLLDIALSQGLDKPITSGADSFHTLQRGIIVWLQLNPRFLERSEVRWDSQSCGTVMSKQPSRTLSRNRSGTFMLKDKLLLWWTIPGPDGASVV